MATCTQCGAPIPLVPDQTSAACPACGTPYHVTNTDAGPQLGPVVRPPRKRINCCGILVAIILGFALAWFGALAYGTYRMHDRALANPESAENAYLITRDFVSEALVAPGSAEWCPLSKSKVTKGSNHRWTVESCVDSQNKFGALQRLDYTAEVQFVDGQWQLLDIDIDE